MLYLVNLKTLITNLGWDARVSVKVRYMGVGCMSKRYVAIHGGGVSG